MKVNELIKKQRKNLNLTLEQVAKHVGVGKSTVRKWETGLIKNMRRDKIAKLADILELSPMDLMGWDENELQATKEDIDNIGKTDVNLHKELLQIKPFTDVKDAMKFVIKYNLKVINPKGLDDLNDAEILEFVNTTLRNTQEVIKTTLNK